MIDNIETLKKEAKVSVLKSLESHDLIDLAISYFEIELGGGAVSGADWGQLGTELYCALYASTGERTHLYHTRDIVSPRADYPTRARDRPTCHGLATFLLPKVAHILPKVDLPEYILSRVDRLSMNGWHLPAACGTTHCMGGFAEVAHGEAGAYIVEHFGHEVGGHVLFLHSAGRTVDFHTDNATAIKTLNEMAGL